jgi:predicted SprT family Zn-dependent metalloprotease
MTAEGGKQTAERLSTELEAALLRQLRANYQELNASYFRRALRQPAIELSDNLRRLGQWDPQRRSIEISRALVIAQPWGIVLEVLKHEMAHQYVHEVLGRSEESAHGPGFREVCERLGIDPRATGLPADPDSNGAVEQRDHLKILERISQLLALAERTSAHEAEAAMSLAQKLMLKYNVDRAALGSQSNYSFRHLGAPSGRIGESERVLSIILGEHFFVEVIWVPVYRPAEGKRGQVLEICGTPQNLEMAAYVHAFLTQSANRLWLEHKRSAGIRSNRERRVYLAGVMEGYRDKLVAEARRDREQGLVWVGDADLSAYYRRRHPNIRHTRSAGHERTEAHGAGRSAGRRLILHRGMNGSGNAGPRLLPPRKS